VKGERLTTKKIAKVESEKPEEKSIIVTPQVLLDATRWLMDHRFVNTRLNDTHVRLVVPELLPDPDEPNAMNPVVFQVITANWESAIVLCHYKFKLATEALISKLKPNAN
jgi:hypothetical protein